MIARDRPADRVIFLVVLAPIGAAVTVGVLLFGAGPHRVFWKCPDCHWYPEGYALVRGCEVVDEVTLSDDM